MEIYFLTVLHTRSLKSRCRKAMLPLKMLGENPSSHCPDSGGSWSPLVGSSKTTIFPVCLWVSFSVSCKDTLIGFRVHFNLILILTLTTSAEILFPNKVSELLGGRGYLGDTIHPTQITSHMVYSYFIRH